MSVESDLFDYLGSVAGLTALLGSGDDFRLWPQRLEDDPTYPAVVYSRISGPRSAYTHDNAGIPPVAVSVLVKARFQFDVWGGKDEGGGYETALDVVAQLVGALSGYKGMMGATQVQSCFIDSETDGFEPDTGSNRRMVDAILTYEEG